MSGISLSERKPATLSGQHPPTHIAGFIRTVPTGDAPLFDIEVVGLRVERVEGVRSEIEAVFAADIATFIATRLDLGQSDPRRQWHTVMHLAFRVEDGVVRSGSYEYRRS